MVWSDKARKAAALARKRKGVGKRGRKLSKKKKVAIGAAAAVGVGAAAYAGRGRAKARWNSRNVSVPKKGKQKAIGSGKSRKKKALKPGLGVARDQTMRQTQKRNSRKYPKPGGKRGFAKKTGGSKSELKAIESKKFKPSRRSRASDKKKKARAGTKGTGKFYGKVGKRPVYQPYDRHTQRSSSHPSRNPNRKRRKR